MEICDLPSVVKKNLDFYDSIKPRGQSGSNKTYTVITTLNDVKSGQLIALATGTQASLRVYPDDIEDCHAESLLKRAYKRYLIDAALVMVQEGLVATSLQSEFSRRYGEQELMMFVSQFPCGLIRRFEGDEPVDEETGAIIKRKPGRGVVRGGKMVYVQRDNCLNKLKRWTSLYGLQGKTMHEQLGIRARPTHLVIGDCEPETSLDYGKQLRLLEQQLATPDYSPTCSLIQMRRDEFVFDSSEKQPQPVAAVWWWSSGNQMRGSVEHVVDGRRKGLTRRQCQSDRQEWRLKSGDWWLRKDMEQIHAALQQ